MRRPVCVLAASSSTRRQANSASAATWSSSPRNRSRCSALLVRRAGEVVTRQEIREHVWTGDTFVDFEQGLNFCIRQVREALGDTADAPRFIETLPRRGYRFLMPVTAAAPEPVGQA